VHPGRCLLAAKAKAIFSRAWRTASRPPGGCGGVLRADWRRCRKPLPWLMAASPLNSVVWHIDRLGAWRWGVSPPGPGYVVGSWALGSGFCQPPIRTTEDPDTQTEGQGKSGDAACTTISAQVDPGWWVLSCLVLYTPGAGRTLRERRRGGGLVWACAAPPVSLTD
jgi:hypothetical protein